MRAEWALRDRRAVVPVGLAFPADVVELRIDEGDRDPLFNQALEIISSDDKASSSLLMRRLKVGYARSARILDELEAAGYVGPAEGSKPREVLRRQSADSVEAAPEGL